MFSFVVRLRNVGLIKMNEIFNKSRIAKLFNYLYSCIYTSLNRRMHVSAPTGKRFFEQ